MKAMLVDDHPLFLEGLKNLLETHEIEVSGTAENGYQALEKARLLRPDFILMDIEMPGCGGIEAISMIKKELPEIKIIMLTSFDNDENLFEAVKKGASGYLLKNLKAEELLTLLHTLDQGDAPLSPGLAARLLEEFARQPVVKKPEPATNREALEREKAKGKLNERQAEVLNLVAEGKSYKEVGAALGISERTVKYHMERILDLLGLENRAQVIAYLARAAAYPIEK